jgi:hypothetical protein
MSSRATDGMSASECQGKWPDQTLDQAFRLPEVLVAVSTSRLSCKKTRTLLPFGIHLENLGLEWKCLCTRRLSGLRWVDWSATPSPWPNCLAADGHQVMLMTRTRTESADNYAFNVLRTTSKRDFIHLVRWSDLVIINGGVVLKICLPAIVLANRIY